MRKAVILLLLITTMDMIAAGILLDSQDYNDESSDEADDLLEEEEDIETEDGNSVEDDVEGETVAEELDRTTEEEWMNRAVQDIAYYLRAHKFNDFDRRYHENEDIAPRVSNLIAIFSLLTNECIFYFRS
jgi:hypothetical protein